MRLRFDVEASAFTRTKHQFPPDTMKTLIVSCTDRATHAIVPLDPARTTKTGSGKFPVDFELSGDLRDTLKFHFFADGDVLMCAGHTPLRPLLEALAATSSTQDQAPAVVLKCQHNFCLDAVTAHVRGTDPEAARAALEAYDRSPPKRSALHDSRRAAVLLKQMADRTECLLHMTTEVRPDNGASLFSNPFTWHAMDGQATTQMHFQADMEPTDEMLGLLLQSGLTTYFLNDTLHYKGLTPKEALAELDDANGPALTEFAAAVCATPQRSIITAPYFPDMAPDLDEFTHTRVKFRTSEHFKRMLSEPFNLRAGHLTHDDCDGSAVHLHTVARSLEHLHALHEAGRLGADAASSLFPPDLHQYDGDDEYARDVLALGLRIGGHLRSGRMASKLVFMSMRGRAAGDGGHAIGGHVAHSLQWIEEEEEEKDGAAATSTKNKKKKKVSTCMNEGTNFFQSHLSGDRMIRLRLKTGEGEDGAAATVEEHRFSMCSLANAITGHLLENAPNTRKCMHISHLSPYPEYFNVFCHGDQQLGTAQKASEEEDDDGPSSSSSWLVVSGNGRGEPDKGPDKEAGLGQDAQRDQGEDEPRIRITFGLAASDIDDPERRIDIEQIRSIPSSDKDRAFLQQHLRDRASEIHPPLVSLDKLRAFLRESWSPTTRVTGIGALKGHARMTCAVSEAFKDPAEREQALRRARFTADRFNAEHGGMGVMATYLSTDAVMTCAHLITDDPKSVTESVRLALMFEAEGMAGGETVSVEEVEGEGGRGVCE